MTNTKKNSKSIRYYISWFILLSFISTALGTLVYISPFIIIGILIFLALVWSIITLDNYYCSSDVEDYEYLYSKYRNYNYKYSKSKYSKAYKG